jgi:hypothetical protein
MSQPIERRRAEHIRAGDVIEVNGRRYRVHLPPMDAANMMHHIVLVVLEASGTDGWVLSQQGLILPRRSAVTRVIGDAS